jgi:hypothetical protein
MFLARTLFGGLIPSRGLETPLVLAPPQVNSRPRDGRRPLVTPDRLVPPHMPVLHLFPPPCSLLGAWRLSSGPNPPLGIGALNMLASPSLAAKQHRPYRRPPHSRQKYNRPRTRPPITLDSERHSHTPPDLSNNLRHQPPTRRPRIGLSGSPPRHPYLMCSGRPLVLHSSTKVRTCIMLSIS